MSYAAGGNEKFQIKSPMAVHMLWVVSDILGHMASCVVLLKDAIVFFSSQEEHSVSDVVL